MLVETSSHKYTTYYQGVRRPFAVAVIAISLVTTYFLARPLVVSAQSDPSCTDTACISTGTQLLNIDSTQSSLLNGLLGNLLGIDLQLTAADWRALAHGDVAVNDLLDGLQTDLAVATPEELLTTDLTLQQLGAAISDLLATERDQDAVDALTQLLNDLDGRGGTIQLGDLLDLDLSNGGSSTVKLNVLDLLTGTIQLFNHDNLLTTPGPVIITGSELGLNGILNEVALQAQVIEPPVYLCGGINSQFYSAAIRLKLHIDLVDADLLVDDLETALDGLLSVVLNIDVAAAIGQIDLYADVARGQGTISMLNGLTGALTISATPGVVDLYVGQINDADFFSRSHVLVPGDLQFGTIGTLAVTVTNAIATVTEVTVNVQARSIAEGANPTAQMLNFTAPYPKHQTVTTSAQFVDNLINGLATNLETQLSGSLGVILDPLVNTTIIPTLDELFTDRLSPILNPLFGDFVDPLLDGTGVGLGEMSVTVEGTMRACADTDTHDDDGDGIPNNGEDPNHNGDPTDDDSDNDGIPDYLDPDDDGDTVPTKDEDPNHNGDPTDDDSDNDGIPDYLDPDDDGDTVPTKDEDPNHNGDPRDDDSDNDGIPDYLDPDDDGDTVPTKDEDPNRNGDPTDDDSDNDGIPDYLDSDDDGDTVPTKDEDPNHNGDPLDDDSDFDAKPNYLDADDDNDTVPTKDEDPNRNGDPRDDDTDGDAILNYLDINDDNDTVITRNEDPNNNGDPQDDDSDGDGLADYLDRDSPGGVRSATGILYLPIVIK
ncbi:MAG: hypothetical protein R2932_01250 [Caldilineaceae bacterium]